MTDPRVFQPALTTANPDAALAGRLAELERRLRAMEQRGRLGVIPIVTSLPADPHDGDTVDFVADATNGILWRLRYRAAESSNYKWTFVGGPPLLAGQSGSETVSLPTAYAGVAYGPTLTYPLAGDYFVEGDSRVIVGNTGIQWFAWTSPNTLGNEYHSFASTGTVPGYHVRDAHRVAGVAASSVSRLYLASAGTSQTAYSRVGQIAATPIRVG